MTAGKHFSSKVGAAGLALGVLAGSLSGSIDARAQSQDERFSASPRPPGLIPGGSFKLFGAQPAPVGTPGKDDWSGESGSSGHPLMQADAIRAAAANFSRCIAGFWPDAAR
ncbi:MAG: rane-bound lytic murein transglycosylase, partial [Alphaproteobacteria bacterium]|nr:rane-bound lytic murein transglycosylase [Alphaproteobacteria bacterium]